MSSNPPTTGPTTRLILKNVPLTYTEQHIRDELVLKTGQGTKQGHLKVDITEVKMLQRNQRFCGVCFVGFKTIDQAITAQKYWNKAFFSNVRIGVDFASVDQTQNQSWSRYNNASLTNKAQLQRLQDESAKRLEKIAQIISSTNKNTKNTKNTKNSTTSAQIGPQSTQKSTLKSSKIPPSLENHPALFGLTSEQQEIILAKPKFLEYLMATKSGKGSKTGVWDEGSFENALGMNGGLNPYATSAASTPDGMPVVNHKNDDDVFFQGPGFGTETKKSRNQDSKTATNDHNDDDDELIVAFEAKLTRKIERQNRNQQREIRRKTQQTAIDDKIVEKKRQLIAGITPSTPSSQSSSSKSSISTKSDADFLKMAMGGFSSDEEEEEEEKSNSIKPEDVTDAQLDAYNGTVSIKDLDYTPESISSDEESSGNDDDDGDDSSKTKSQSKRQKTINTAAEGVNDDSAEVQLPPIDPRDAILQSSAIFVRNLPFQTTQEELLNFFDRVGPVEEVQFPQDRFGNSIGYATILYRIPEDAYKSFQTFSGQLFQGRFLHVVPGVIKDAGKDKYSDDQLQDMSYKRKKELQQKSQATNSYNWNSLFISADTIANAVSAKMDIKKADLLGADASADSHSAAVRLAVAETHMINETKDFLVEHGVVLDKFNSTPNSAANNGSKRVLGGNDKSTTVILIKNIPFNTEENELRKLFKKHAVIDRLILPPYKTLALVEITNTVQAKTAFANLAYKKFKEVPLYLEWAPKGCLLSSESTGHKGGAVMIDDNHTDTANNASALLGDGEQFDRDTCTLFVKNIHFDTSDDQLQTHFISLLEKAYKMYVTETYTQNQQVEPEQWRIRTSRIMRRNVASSTGVDKERKVGELVSLGYGFIELSAPQAAKALVKFINSQNGSILLGHMLAVRLSQPDDTGANLTKDGSSAQMLKNKSILISKGVLSEDTLKQQQLWSQNNQKVIVRNIPFEAGLREIRETFQSFGQVKRCTIPKKQGSTTSRGYAFVEFISPLEAQNAVEALRNTHIFGRHLVIEWAKPDESIEDLREKAQKSITNKR